MAPSASEGCGWFTGRLGEPFRRGARARGESPGPRDRARLRIDIDAREERRIPERCEHSTPLRAFTAPLLCDRADVRLLVLAAPMIPAPGESPGAWWSSSGQVDAKRRQDELEGRDHDAAVDVRDTLMHDLPDELVAAAFARGEPRQSDTPFAEPWPLDAWPDIPTRVIACRYDRLFPLEVVRELARGRLGVVADVIDTGHRPALSRPDELAERLAAYAEANAPR